MAGWQSGHAADCKSVYAGSIPASASKINIFAKIFLYNNFFLRILYESSYYGASRKW